MNGISRNSPREQVKDARHGVEETKEIFNDKHNEKEMSMSIDDVTNTNNAG